MAHVRNIWSELHVFIHAATAFYCACKARRLVASRTTKYKSTGNRNYKTIRQSNSLPSHHHHHHLRHLQTIISQIIIISKTRWKPNIARFWFHLRISATSPAPQHIFLWRTEERYVCNVKYILQITREFYANKATEIHNNRIGAALCRLWSLFNAD